jgi:hypothetical protein
LSAAPPSKTPGRDSLGRFFDTELKEEIARMLDANLKAQLKSYLERVTQPIEIVASLDDGAKSRKCMTC